MRLLFLLAQPALPNAPLPQDASLPHTLAFGILIQHSWHIHCIKNTALYYFYSMDTNMNQDSTKQTHTTQKRTRRFFDAPWLRRLCCYGVPMAALPLLLLAAFRLSAQAPPAAPVTIGIHAKATRTPAPYTPIAPQPELGQPVSAASHFGLFTTASTAAMQAPLQQQAEDGIIQFSHGQVALITQQGKMPLERLRATAYGTQVGSTLDLHTDMFSAYEPEQETMPLLYGEAVDETNTPLRWKNAVDVYADNTVLECPRSQNPFAEGVARLMGKIRPGSAPLAMGSHKPFQRFIEVYAAKYRLSPALILAIMHTESNFSPAALSASNAMGLMQVVPETAGEEAHNYLTGTRAIPNAQTLFNPESNIRYGATYLYLLDRFHFGRIVNPVSRQLCVIAAYNGGPGAVHRVFDQERDVATAKINSLSSDAVYDALTGRMPSAESRLYVDKVLRHYYNYLQNTTPVATR